MKQVIKNAVSVRALLALALLISVQVPLLADIHDRIEYKLNRVLRDVEIINNELAAECRTIVPKDFQDSNGNFTQTYVISEPGKYCLGADIDFEPIDEFQPVIQILSDNVRLDLSGFRLDQANDTANAYGILIGQGLFYDDPNAVLQNISIANGEITNFTGCGIYCKNSSFDDPTNPSFLQIPFKSLEFLNLNILDCGSNPSTSFGTGIDLGSNILNASLTNDTYSASYKNVLIENCNVNRCLGGAAINIAVADNIIVKDTQANDSITTISFGFPAAYFITARNLQMYNCQGNGTQLLDPNSTLQVGSFLLSCFNVYMNNCQFNDTYGESASIVNFNPSNSQNFVAEDCQFNNARGGARAAIVVGIHMSDSSFQQIQGDGMKFINCQFNGALSKSTLSSSNTGGFLAITARNMIFERCQSCNISNFALSNRGIFGFFLVTDATDPIPFYSNMQNITFSNCVVSDLNSRVSQACGFLLGGRAIGRIGQQSVNSNVVLENCIAERIFSSTTTAEVAGIAETPNIFADTLVAPLLNNLFIKGCRISQVRSTGAAPSPRSAGILVESVNYPVVTQNSVSDCDRGILLTGTNAITPSTLFQLATSPANALALPPVQIDLKGNTTYSTGTASQGVTTGSTTVQGIGTAFTSAMVGGTISFGTVAGTGSQAGDLVTATAAVFTADMIGDTISFPNGYTAYIIGFISSTVVRVSVRLPAPLPPAQPFTVNRNVAVISAVNVGLQRLTVTRRQVVAAQPFTITYGLPVGAQKFTDLTTANSVTITPTAATVDLNRDYLRSTPTNLNSLGWKLGDPILYDNLGNGNIPDLVTTTTYYLIVYNPGFTNRGVIEENEVDNCTIRGYVETRPGSVGTTGAFGSGTTSAWINNIAVDNGPTGLVPVYQGNYDITWASGIDPVDDGLVDGPYPVGLKYYNLSLRP